MIQKVLLVALVLIAAQAIHLNQAHGAVLQAGTATFKADNGNFMRACYNCGGSKTFSASIRPESDEKEQRWIITPVDNQVTIKGSNGAYLALCNGCFTGKYQDSATVHGSESMPESLWTPEKLSNGKFAFKGKNGKYLGRCDYCANNGVYTSMAYVHISSSSAKEAQWTITYE